VEHTGDIGSTSRPTEAPPSVDCWLISMWAVVERNDGASATTDSGDSASMRSEPSPPLGLAVNKPDLIGPREGIGRGSGVVCIGSIAG